LKKIAIASGTILLICAGLIWMTVFAWEPIPYWIATWNLDQIQHSLIYGEPRTRIEAKFGKGFKGYAVDRSAGASGSTWEVFYDE
jgi:hypothetical protein